MGCQTKKRSLSDAQRKELVSSNRRAMASNLIMAFNRRAIASNRPENGLQPRNWVSLYSITFMTHDHLALAASPPQLSDAIRNLTLAKVGMEFVGQNGSCCVEFVLCSASWTT